MPPSPSRVTTRKIRSPPLCCFSPAARPAPAQLPFQDSYSGSCYTTVQAMLAFSICFFPCGSRAFMAFGSVSSVSRLVLLYRVTAVRIASMLSRLILDSPFSVQSQLSCRESICDRSSFAFRVRRRWWLLITV